MSIQVNKFPLVSIIVATYRRDDSLKFAIQSLMNQSYKNIEVIIIDDNADNYWNKKVENVYNEFKSDKRLRYIKNDGNLGSAKTRNVGIYSSKGEYVSFLDDDDIYLPKKIENQVNKMIKMNADYSITNLTLYYENEEAVVEVRNRDFLIDCDPKDLLKLHLMYHLTGTDTMMFKRDYLVKIGGFDPIDVGDEFYLMHKAILANGKFLYIPESNVNAYIHRGEGGLSSGKGKIDGENKLFRFKEDYFDILSKKDVKFIKMRHYAVLAFAYYRLNMKSTFIKYALISFIQSPMQCLDLFISRNKVK